MNRNGVHRDNFTFSLLGRILLLEASDICSGCTRLEPRLVYLLVTESCHGLVHSARECNVLVTNLGNGVLLHSLSTA